MQDELLWAATWLYIATRKPKYLKYIKEESVSASVAEFSWDLKYAGAQIILSQVPFCTLAYLFIWILIFFYLFILKILLICISFW